MTEHSLWLTMRRRLGPYGKFIRIEDRSQEGVPDVLCLVQGQVSWIELKRINWPARPSTIISIPSLKLEQVRFLLDWSRAGGSAWLLLQASRDYLLLSPWHVEQLFHGRYRRLDVIQAATVRGAGSFPAAPIFRTLLGKPFPTKK